MLTAKKETPRRKYQRRSQKKIMVSVRLPQEDVRALDDLAAQDGRTRSAVLAEIIEWALEDLGLRPGSSGEVLKRRALGRGSAQSSEEDSGNFAQPELAQDSLESWASPAVEGETGQGNLGGEPSSQRSPGADSLSPRDSSGQSSPRGTDSTISPDDSLGKSGDEEVPVGKSATTVPAKGVPEERPSGTRRLGFFRNPHTEDEQDASDGSTLFSKVSTREGAVMAIWQSNPMAIIKAHRLGMKLLDKISSLTRRKRMAVFYTVRLLTTAGDRLSAELIDSADSLEDLMGVMRA